MARRTDTGFSALRIEGGLFPSEFLLTVAAGEAGDQDNAAYGLTRSLHLRDEIGRCFRIAADLYADFRVRPDDARVAVDGWLAPLLAQVFGYRALEPVPTPIELEGRRFPITHRAQGGAVPLVLVPPAYGLDGAHARFGDDGRRRTAMGLLQELLNASDDHLWGLASDGRALRLLRKNPSFTRPAWIELDLERTFEDVIYADFAAFWLLAHGTRLETRETGNPAACILERWRQVAVQTGERAKAKLRDGVARALVALGEGFVRHKANNLLRQKLRDGVVIADDLHQELLRLVYRFLFLFVVEDRGLLHPPGTPPEARKLWAEGYGVGHLRERSLRPRLFDTHGDLWHGLRITFMALERGALEIGAPALNGGLFNRGRIPDLFEAELSNVALLEAIKALAFFRPDRARSLARVNYRDLGTEEFGSVYESLLELHPMIEREPWGFRYVGLNGDVTRGNERKLSGSYYTPDSLVQELIKSALEPVIRHTATDHPYDQRRALLALRILDPACGSGHFLLAAARRLAYEVARIDAAPDAPTEIQRQQALREVVQHCIYGVDRNPLAVELCKTALWIETVEPGRPLSFLDHRIREGNSLIGVFDLAVLDDGIPDAAYAPKTGDDKAYARDLRAQNKAERERPLLRRSVSEDLKALAVEFARLAAMREDALAEVDAKARRFREITADQSRHRLEVAADLWTAAFFAPLGRREGQPARVPTTLDVWKAWAQPGGTEGPRPAEAQDLAAANRFFHWPLEFPEVFDPARPAAERGFDVVLGNPPWEVLQLAEEEFFAERHEAIARAPNKAAREQMIKGLAESENSAERRLFADYRAAVHASDAEGFFVRGSGRWPLSAVGKLNTYALFAELFLRLINERGRAGIIVPTGIATDDSTKRFFGELISTATLASLLAFENEEFIFRGLHHAYRFALLTLRGDGRSTQPEFAFFCRRPEHLADRRRRFTLSREDIALINPNTRTCPIFRTGHDAELTKVIYRRLPVLLDESMGKTRSPWGISFRQGLFNMASDSSLFRTFAQLREAGGRLDRTVWTLPDGERWLPLYEAKMIHHFDHRWASYSPDGDNTEPGEAEKGDPAFCVLPRYWVNAGEVDSRLTDKGWTRGWLMGWRDVTGVEKVRTVITSAIPRVPVNHKTPLFFTAHEPRATAALYANLCSLVFDFIARQKVGGTSLTFFILKQLPVLPPSTYGTTDLDFIVPRVLELTYTAWDMQPFARDVGYDGEPFRWDPERRAVLRAELDAYYAWLYGLTRDELRYVLDPNEVMGDDWPSESFRVLKEREVREHGEYRTRRLVLDAFDRFHEDGTFEPARVRDPHYFDAITKQLATATTELQLTKAELEETKRTLAALLSKADRDDLPTLFVEGEDDAEIVAAAWGVLFPEEPMPFKVIAAGGTTQMRPLAVPGKALRPVIGERLLLALADNDGEGRDLWRDGRLHQGGSWRQQTNGIWWCLLEPTDEFRKVMDRFKIDVAYWPFTIENAFSAALRRQALAEGVYALGKVPQADLLKEQRISIRVLEALADLPDDDPAVLYLRRPTPEAKDTFAAWVTEPARLTRANYAAFAPVLANLMPLIAQHEAARAAADLPRQARLV